MDFKAMLTPVNFGGRRAPEEMGVPAPHLRRQSATRRLAMLKEATEVLTVMPGPGEALHAIMTGRYDLADLIDAAMAKLGTIEHLRIATLSFNARNVLAMGKWIESGKVRRLTILCSRFFSDHNPALFENLREVFQEHGRGHRIAAARNHCKVACLHTEDGQKLALEGSANLRTNSNTEQFALVNDAELHDWHCAFIDDQVKRNEGEQSHGPATG
jgi:hypothetical protein